MRGLKILVIALGIAILVAASVLATLIFERAGRLASAPAAVAQATLALPAGARVLESRIDGNRVMLRAAEAGGEALYVFDAATARLTARYAIATGVAR